MRTSGTIITARRKTMPGSTSHARPVRACRRPSRPFEWTAGAELTLTECSSSRLGGVHFLPRERDLVLVRHPALEVHVRARERLRVADVELLGERLVLHVARLDRGVGIAVVEEVDHVHTRLVVDERLHVLVRVAVVLRGRPEHEAARPAELALARLHELDGKPEAGLVDVL